MSWMRLAAALLLLLAGLALYVYRSLTTFEVERVAPDVLMVHGHHGPLMASSNVALLRTDAGPVVVDTMTFPFHGRLIQRFAAELTGGPVQAVINTHYHQDHTHGNPAFRTGTRVIATARTREHLLARDGAYWEGEARALLPNETFADAHELTIGGKTVRALFVGRGHTDGDLVVLFPAERVLVGGDLVWNRRYPNIDLEAGGSIAAWITALDRILALEFDHVIPGHGALTDRAGVRAFQAFLRELWAASEAAAAAGWSLEQTLAATRLTTDAGYAGLAIPFVIRLDRDFVVRRGWEEATGAVQPDGR